MKERIRESGILMPIASLAGPYGIGTIGAPALRFIDFLREAKQHIWQILPLSPTGYGDSPYQSVSAFAGNPYFIDLPLLCEEKLLTKDECRVLSVQDDNRVDYAFQYAQRFTVLRKAFTRFSAYYPDDYYRFCYEQHAWIEDYALFMTAKGLNSGKPYTEWPEAQRLHRQDAIDALYKEHENEVHFWKFLQYEFFKQWRVVLAYAHENGVRIMGDLPIYVAADSADVWANRHLFQLDAAGLPIDVAGCPPDLFTKDGQLWGNPLYNWDALRETDYAWWVQRVQNALATYDILRIDHFRGFDTYYAIPYGSKNARKGEWRQGPRMELFHALEAALGRDLPIVAEDLGALFGSVRDLLRESGYPGMKPVHFAFDNEDNEYQPHHHTQNCVTYAGTHDNQTTAGWLATMPKKSRTRAAAYMGLNPTEGEVNGVLRTVMASAAYLCITTPQDWLALGDEARINTPGTLGGTNWQWRISGKALTPALAKRMAAMTTLYGRLGAPMPEKKKEPAVKKA